MSTPPDPFEFVRNLWSQMGIPGFGAGGAPAMPSFAPEDLEKRIGELKQVRQWLEINLNMLNLQVNGLEMQLSAIKGFKSSPGGEMAAQATRAMQDAMSGQGAFAGSAAGAAAAPAFGAGGFGGFPFGAAPPVAASPPAAPIPQEPEPPKPAASGPAKAPAWPDPTSWMQTLQDEFVKNMKSIAPAGADAGRRPAAKKAAARPAAPRKAPARKRTRGTP